MIFQTFSLIGFFFIFLNDIQYKTYLCNLAIELLFWFHKTNHRIKLVLFNIYQTKELEGIRNCIEVLSNVSNDIKQTFKEFQSPSDVWVSIVLKKDEHNDIDEHIYHSHDFLSPELNQTIYSKLSTMVNDCMSQITKNTTSLITMKFYDKTLMGINNINHLINSRTMETCKPTYQFLTIVYSSKISEPIPLSIDNNLFNPGNQVFSYLHIMHLLTEMNKMHLYDEKYELKFIDDNINMFSITSSQYIELNSEQYQVKTLDQTI